MDKYWRDAHFKFVEFYGRLEFNSMVEFYSQTLLVDIDTFIFLR